AQYTTIPQPPPSLAHHQRFLSATGDSRSGGRFLVPLHLPSLGAPSQKPVTEAPEINFSGEIARSGGEKASEAATTTANGGVDSAYLFSPKTPRCSSRWRELLGLKKSIEANHNSTSSASSSSVSSRLSLSSSSFDHDVDDFRRLSLDTNKNLHLNRSSSVPNPPKVRLVKSKPPVMDHSGSGVGRGRR
ncbi:hypothetical protein Drorol1_Dr00013740, partial [Drosera rotundifolia]